MKRELKSYLAGWLALYLAAVCLPFLLGTVLLDGKFGLSAYAPDKLADNSGLPEL